MCTSRTSSATAKMASANDTVRSGFFSVNVGMLTQHARAPPQRSQGEVRSREVRSTKSEVRKAVVLRTSDFVLSRARPGFLGSERPAEAHVHQRHCADHLV